MSDLAETLSRSITKALLEAIPSLQSGVESQISQGQSEKDGPASSESMSKCRRMAEDLRRKMEERQSRVQRHLQEKEILVKGDLSSVEKKMGDLSRFVQGTESLDRRFRKISYEAPDLTIPKLHSQASSNQKEDIISEIFNKLNDPHETTINKWLVDTTEKILCTTFNLMDEKGMDFEKCKIYFSENMLSNIFDLLQKNQKVLSYKNIQYIDEHLCQNIFDYCCKKYPLSEQKSVNRTLEKMVLKVNRYEDISNDLVAIATSKNKFTFSPDKNYTNYIKDVLKYISELPYKPIKRIQKEDQVETGDTTLKEQFENYINDLFDVKDPDFYYDIAKEARGDIELIESKLREKIIREQPKDGDNSQRTGERQIGCKLKNTLNEKKDSSKIVDISNPALLRIVCKWCEGLEGDYFESSNFLMKRTEPFKNKNNQEIFLLSEDKEELCRLFELQKETLEFRKKKLRKHMFKLQYKILREERYHKLAEIAPETEARLGYFVAIIREASETYLLNYLNIIIHSIMKVEYKFGKYLEAKKKGHRHNVEGNGEKENLDMNPEAPNLVTMRLGDILRCRFKGSEKEVIALYTKLIYQAQVKQKKQNEASLEIVRVKNRLSQGTKDLLINGKFDYNGHTCICEIQLAIRNDQGHFIHKSYKYAHFIYELMRTPFGCIDEMCRVWSKFDERYGWYQQKLNLMNIQSVAQARAIVDKCPSKEHRMAVEDLPFWCSNCDKLNLNLDGHSRFILKHESCQNCDYKICGHCRIKKFRVAIFTNNNFEQGNSQYEQQIQLSKDINIVHQNVKESLERYQTQQKIELQPFFISYESESLIKKELSSIEPLYSFSLLEENSIFKIEKKYVLYSENKKIIFTKNEKKNFTYKDVSSYKDLQNFEHSHWILRPKKNEGDEMKFSQSEISDFQDITTLYLKDYVAKKCYESKTSLFKIEFPKDKLKNPSIITEVIQAYLNKPFLEVRTLILINCCIAGFRDIVKIFPNVQIACLDKNKITDISGLDAWGEKLKNLSMKKNGLKNQFLQESVLKSLKKLQKLNLEDNQISKWHDIGLPLDELNLSHNKLEGTVKISNLKNLKTLNVSSNEKMIKIQGLSAIHKIFATNCSELEQIEGNLDKGLQQINIDGCYQLKQIPSEFWYPWIIIRQVCLSNCLKKLPDIPELVTDEDLKKIRVLSLTSCQELEKIYPLKRGNEEIKNLEGLENVRIECCEKLRELNIKSPKLLFSGENIEIPKISDNVTEIQIKNLIFNSSDQLSSLITDKNSLEKVEIEKIQIKNEKQNYIPLTFFNEILLHKLARIQKLSLRKINIEKLPTKFYFMKNLQSLEIIDCRVSLEMDDESNEENVLPRLNELAFEDLDWDVIPSWIKSLTQLKILKLTKMKLDEQAFKKLYSSKDEEEIRASQIAIKGKIKATKVEKVILKELPLRRLSDFFYSLTSLRELQLLKMPALEEISDKIENLKGLERFTMIDCTEFEMIQERINKNQIESRHPPLPKNIASLKNLKSVTFQGMKNTESRFYLLKMAIMIKRIFKGSK